jgi:hypothetical protein
MRMQFGWLAIAIVATVAYHVVLKVTPPAASPFLSLAVSYAAGSLIFLLLYAVMPGGTSVRAGLQALNWTAFALTAASAFLTSSPVSALSHAYCAPRGANHRPPKHLLIL